MNSSPHPCRLVVGLGLAALSLAASWFVTSSSPGPAMRFAQSPEGVAAFPTALAAPAVQPADTLIVLEASGSYWLSLAVTLHQAGYVVSGITLAHAHAFAASLPRRAKTDALEAQLLARFAAAPQASGWIPPEQIYHELRQGLLVRDGLLSMRQQARNQRHALSQWPVTVQAARSAVDNIVAECESQLQSLEAESATLLGEGAWAEAALMLASIRGIGLLTSAWLLVATLNCTFSMPVFVSTFPYPRSRRYGDENR